MSDPLSITASIVAVLQLAATATKLLKDVKGGASDRTRLRDELRSTVLLLEMLKDRVEDAEDQWVTSMGVFAGPEGPLRHFKVTLELLVSKIASSQSRVSHVAQALKWPFDKDDVNKFLGALERYKSLFSLAMQNDHIKLSQEMHQKVNQIGQTLEDMHVGQEHSLNEHIVDWICPISFRKKQSDVLSQMQPGTGQWLLQSPQFLNWMSTSDEIVVLRYSWSWEDAYIYCGYSLREEQTVINLVSSIFQQLIERLRVLPSTLRIVCERHKQQRTRPTLAEWTTMLKECLPQFPTVSIVIDALDESSETNGTREGLVSIINQLGPNLRFLCTSRPLTSIERTFQTYNRLEIQANDYDVELFLRQRIEEEARLRTHTQSEPSLVDLITNTIIAEVKGMFLLAQLHVESLAQKQTRKALRAALNKLPKGLDDTYKEAMQRIHSQGEEDALLAERVICWLSYAMEPLTVFQLQHAIAAQDVEDDDKFIDSDSLPIDDIMITVCCGLVIVDNESKIIRLVHYTTQDYFERNRDQLFPTASAELAKACLTYLTLRNFYSGPCQTDADMEDRLQSMPFLLYSAKFWVMHVRIAPIESCWDHIISLIDDDNAVQICTQTLRISEYRYEGSSQDYRRNVPKLVHIAAFDLAQVLEHVLAEGPDLEYPDSHGQTALMKASEFGFATNVQLLLEAGASVDAEGRNSENALLLAARYGHREVLNLLLEAGASINAAESRNGDSALLLAARYGHSEVLDLLLEASASINAENRHGENALLLAARYGNREVLDLLLKAGASINAAESRNDDSALLLAARYGHSEVLDLLLKAGASINAAESRNVDSALLLAADYGHLKILDLLLEAGASVSHQNEDGWTSLMFAATRGQQRSVVTLIQNGADVNSESKLGESALTMVIEFGDNEICQTLLDHCAVLPRTLRGAEAKLRARRLCNDRSFEQLRFAQPAPSEKQEDELERIPNWGAHELDELKVLVRILRCKEEAKRWIRRSRSASQ